MSSRFGLILLGVMAVGCARGVSEPAPDFSFEPAPGSGKADAGAGAKEAGAMTRDGEAQNGTSGEAGAQTDASVPARDDAGATCGDQSCQSGETCTSCAADCGACPAGYCGDGTCQASEGCGVCPIDCGSCGGKSSSDCGSCSLLTLGRESDCIGNTLFRCHKSACLLSQPCGTRTCTRPDAGDIADAQASCK